MARDLAQNCSRRSVYWVGKVGDSSRLKIHQGYKIWGMKSRRLDSTRLEGSRSFRPMSCSPESFRPDLESIRPEYEVVSPKG